MRFLFLLVGLLLALPAAEARMHAPYRGHRIVQTATAPLDTFTAPSGAYSFRKLKSTYSGPAIRIRRASDNLETDINFLGFVPGLGAPWDEAAANAHCAATTCSVVTMYDQSGNGRNLPLGTTAPTLVLGGAPNSIAHMRMTSASFALVGSSFTPATGVVSMSVVANRSAGVGPCGFLRENGAANRLQGLNAAPSWSLIGGGGGTINAAAADAAWHAGIGVVNGASSVLNIDGAETTGTATGNTVAGVIQVSGIATTTCDEVEWVFWDNYVLTPGERSAWISNQRGFWNF